MKQTINKDWELEARRKLSNYWAGDWKILDDFISTLLKQQKQELREKMPRFITTDCPKCKKYITIEL